MVLFWFDAEAGIALFVSRSFPPFFGETPTFDTLSQRYDIGKTPLLKSNGERIWQLATFVVVTCYAHPIKFG